MKCSDSIIINIMLLGGLTVIAEQMDLSPNQVFASKEIQKLDAVCHLSETDQEAQQKSFILLAQTMRQVGLRIINEAYPEDPKEGVIN